MVEEFVVVDGPSAYNAILERPAIHNFKVVPSTYHQVMMFPIRNEMGSMVGQQQASRECYTIAMKEPKAVCTIKANPGEQRPTASSKAIKGDFIRVAVRPVKSRHRGS